MCKLRAGISPGISLASALEKLGQAKIKTLRHAKTYYQKFYNICHLTTENDRKLGSLYL